MGASGFASRGLFSWLTGESSSSLPPLDTPLTGFPPPSSLPDYVEPGKTKITTLSNGLKIASETSPVCENVYSFLYVDMFNDGVDTFTNIV